MSFPFSLPPPPCKQAGRQQAAAVVEGRREGGDGGGEREQGPGYDSQQLFVPSQSPLAAAAAARQHDPGHPELRCYRFRERGVGVGAGEEGFITTN